MIPGTNTTNANPFAQNREKETKVRTMAQAKSRYQQELLQKEFGDQLTQRIPGSTDMRQVGSISMVTNPVQFVDPKGADYAAWEKELNQRISSVKAPTSGKAEILKQGRENVFLQAARLREDRRYGINPQDYYQESASSGGTARRYAYYDVRSDLIRNAQVRKSQEEARLTKESREKEQAIIGGVRSGGRGSRVSLLSLLGSEEQGRYGGIA